ncbi:hypothetical protein [Pseudalkalibacillus sp. NRS-1564]|uniref:hypothetical protein n=1 Tax=Pseudalkalibacillus sp. NRS-1564 TaxID=3233900 RepID=UPI003D277D5E
MGDSDFKTKQADRFQSLGEEIISILIKETGTKIVRSISEFFSNPSERVLIHKQAKDAINNPSSYNRKELEDLEKAITYFIKMNIKSTPSPALSIVPVYGLLRFSTNLYESHSLETLEKKLRAAIHLRDYTEYVNLYKSKTFKSSYFEHHPKLMEEFQIRCENDSVPSFLARLKFYYIDDIPHQFFLKHRKDEDYPENYPENFLKMLDDRTRYERILLEKY